jgi:hypothetical protein
MRNASGKVLQTKPTKEFKIGVTFKDSYKERCGERVLLLITQQYDQRPAFVNMHTEWQVKIT